MRKLLFFFQQTMKLLFVNAKYIKLLYRLIIRYDIFKTSSEIYEGAAFCSLFHVL